MGQCLQYSFLLHISFHQSPYFLELLLFNLSFTYKDQNVIWTNFVIFNAIHIVIYLILEDSISILDNLMMFNRFVSLFIKNP